jgi:hypothetical protein
MSDESKRETRVAAITRMAQAMRDDNPPDAWSWQKPAPSVPMGHFAAVGLRELAGGDPPPLMDARPVLLWTVHCSECQEPYLDFESEQPVAFPVEHLAKLGEFIPNLDEDDTDGWRINRYPGRPLVCGECVRHEQCSACGLWMARWEEQAESEDGPRHADGCPSTAVPLPGQEPLIGGDS